jgi:hypothetical protein
MKAHQTFTVSVNFLSSGINVLVFSTCVSKQPLLFISLRRKLGTSDIASGMHSVPKGAIVFHRKKVHLVA